MNQPDKWKDGRTSDRAVRHAANECLRAWEVEHGETLEPVSRTGSGAVFESDGHLVVGRTSKTESLRRNPGLVHWSSISPSQFAKIEKRAARERKRLIFLLVSHESRATRYFEIDGAILRWSQLPKRSSGDAYFKVFSDRGVHRLETIGKPIDLSGMERRLAITQPAVPPPTPGAYTGIVTIDARVRSGKPSIRGLRITVQDILEYLAGGMTEEQIVEDFPDLTREDIRACLAFAADRERRLRSVV